MNNQQVKLTQSAATKNANVELLIEEYKMLIEEEKEKIVI